MLNDSNRIQQIDKAFVADVTTADFHNQLFQRLVAKKKRFTKVDFRYCIFDTCYLRNCTFDSCNFTGCRFTGCNLIGSSFPGCIFDYAQFERTVIDNDILNEACPAHENLKMKFARSLRMNYQQLGDARSVNKAMGVELQATEIALDKAWRSNDYYYRNKYRGITRVERFLIWLEFKALDFIWGNGESAWKLLRALLLWFGLMALVDVLSFKDAFSVTGYIRAFFEAPAIFLGVLTPPLYTSSYLAGITFVRLTAFALFVSIIIKRLNRR